MDVITKEEFLQKKDHYVHRIKKGAVFIHPTDTIYGIGCDATNEEAVQKIRAIKQRPDMPFSVIAPSKKWVYDHCDVRAEAVPWVEKLPGPYTLVFTLTGRTIAPSVAPDVGTLGVRIPDNWFAQFVAELNVPVVSTSANITGAHYMQALEDLDDALKQKIDFAIYEGEKQGRPSTIVKLYEERLEIVRR